VFIKASVRRKLGEQIVPLAATPVRVRVLGPTDDSSPTSRSSPTTWAASRAST
jgi:hypothetical protein